MTITNIGESASGEKTFLGSINNVQFQQSKLEEITTKLEKNENVGQAEMNILVAAEKVDVIKNHLHQFKGLNLDTARWLKELGAEETLKSNIIAFRDKYQSRVANGSYAIVEEAA